MAFGITREELNEWKNQVKSREIAYLTHFWYDERFPDVKTVTKVLQTFHIHLSLFTFYIV